jgi:acyl-CoA thioesterase FadM
LLVEMWVDVRGPIGRTYGDPPPEAGELRLAGRIYAQHVITRLFAEPAERKVLRLPGVPGMPEVPETRGSWIAPAEAMKLPPGAKPLEPTLRPDVAPIAFGVAHTDSNQHVNSLVYPRLFEDAALRRFAALGRATDVLSRFAQAGFRKPCFAGERAAIVLQTFELDGRLGAAGMFVSEEDAASPEAVAKARPRCAMRMMFE